MPPIFYNGIECNDVYFNGVKTTGFLNGNQIWGSESKPIYTLTLQTDGHGTLNANTLTGYAGDTVNLTTAYNTYYRFSGYGVTGGSVAGNVFTFGSADATVKANFKVNSFTASGNFVTTAGSTFSGTSANSAKCYAVVNSKSTNVPSNYLTSVTSYFYSGANTRSNSVFASGWKPASNVSAYKVSGNFSGSWHYSFVYDTSITARSRIYSNNSVFATISSKRSGSVSSTGTFTSANANPGLLMWELSSSMTRISGYAYTKNSTWSASGIAP